MAATDAGNIDIIIGDYFDTIIKQWGGYYLPGSDYVVIAQGFGEYYDSSGEYHKGRVEQRRKSAILQIKRATKHELNHAVLGALPGRWLEEAVTEHIAEVFERGDIEKVRPSERHDSLATYEEERNLLHTILTCGKDTISASMATRAYSSAYYEAERQSETEFFAALDKSWGVRDFIYTINDAVERYEQEISLELSIVASAESEGESAVHPSEWAIQDMALRRIQSDLLQQPERIFGAGYRKPELQMA